jgi:hypothetical protein
MTRRFLLCLTALLASLCPADTLEFFGGRSVENATVLKIAEGFIYFIDGQGTKLRAELHTLKTITPAVRKDDYFTVTRFEDGMVGKLKGKFIGVTLHDDRVRIAEPLVRVLVLAEGSKGDRVVHLFANHRVDDPTTTWKLPMVDSSAYTTRNWFVPIENAAAWRIEGWVDGRLRLEQETRLSETVTDDWYRTQKLFRATPLDEADPAVIPGAETTSTSATSDPDQAPISVRVTSARLKENFDGGGKAGFTISYQVSHGNKEQLELRPPVVTLYYVTENAQKQRAMDFNRFPRGKTVTLPPGANLTRSEECTLPKNVTTGARSFDMDKDAGLERLIFWRVEIVQGTKVLAFAESSDAKVAATLPPNWWQ